MSAFTLKEGIEAYIGHLQAQGKKGTTIGVYKKALALAAGHFGEDRDLARMLPAHAAGFLKSDAVLKKPDGAERAEISVEQIRRVFRQMLTFCRDKGLIESLPLPKDELAKARGQAPDAA